MLWIAFAIVHVVIAVLGFVLPNQPMGDVFLVYEPWATWRVEGRAIVGVTETWVYPQLALVPMILAQGFAWIAGYEVALGDPGHRCCDALAFARAGRPGPLARACHRAAWFWLAFIAPPRADRDVPDRRHHGSARASPVRSGSSGRPGSASTLLAIATWIKIWPAALLAAAVIAVRAAAARVIGAAALVTR